MDIKKHLSIPNIRIVRFDRQDIIVTSASAHIDNNENTTIALGQERQSIWE